MNHCKRRKKSRRLIAARDPRHMHLLFYEDTDPYSSSSEPVKRQSSPTTEFADPSPCSYLA